MYVCLSVMCFDVCVIYLRVSNVTATSIQLILILIHNCCVYVPIGLPRKSVEPRINTAYKQYS